MDRLMLSENRSTRSLRESWGGSGYEPLRLMLDLLNATRPMDTGGLWPAFEVREKRDGYVLRADVPGVRESDLVVEFDHGTLTISGRRSDPVEDEAGYVLRERPLSAAFSRSLTLPQDADGEAIRASLESGVLTLEIGKKSEPRIQRIPIRVEAGGAQGKVRSWWSRVKRLFA